MAYSKYNNLEKRTQSDIVLKNKAFKIASNSRHNGYERRLASMVYKFFDKKSKGSGFKNQQLANEQHKTIIKNIWGVYLAHMQLISKHNKGVKCLVCVIDLFSKYDWVVPLKDKKGVSIVNAFQKFSDSSKRKPNKIWADQRSEFYNNVFKKWLKNNDISMYSAPNEGKSVVAGRFIKTLKNKIYKHMIAISKNVYFNVLNDIVDEYNNTYHKTIKKSQEMLEMILLLNKMKNLMKKIQNLKWVIMLGFQSTKIFLLKVINQIGVKKFLLLKKYKILCLGHK